MQKAWEEQNNNIFDKLKLAALESTFKIKSKELAESEVKKVKYIYVDKFENTPRLRTSK